MGCSSETTSTQSCSCATFTMWNLHKSLTYPLSHQPTVVKVAIDSTSAPHLFGRIPVVKALACLIHTQHVIPQLSRPKAPVSNLGLLVVGTKPILSVGAATSFRLKHHNLTHRQSWHKVNTIIICTINWSWLRTALKKQEAHGPWCFADMMACH